MSDEMVEGYMDGSDKDSPEAGENRTASYKHGFLNGRDDLNNKPRASAGKLRRVAEAVLNEDDFNYE